MTQFALLKRYGRARALIQSISETFQCQTVAIDLQIEKKNMLYHNYGPMKLDTIEYSYIHIIGIVFRLAKTCDGNINMKWEISKAFAIIQSEKFFKIK